MTFILAHWNPVLVLSLVSRFPHYLGDVFLRVPVSVASTGSQQEKRTFLGGSFKNDTHVLPHGESTAFRRFKREVGTRKTTRDELVPPTVKRIVPAPYGHPLKGPKPLGYPGAWVASLFVGIPLWGSGVRSFSSRFWFVCVCFCWGVPLKRLLFG